MANVPPSASSRCTCGSRMPCGRSARTRAMASRTSVTARSIGVPILNSTMIKHISFGNVGLLVVNIADAGNRAFHFLRDLRLHFRGRGAGLRNIDVDCREGNIRIQVDRQANEGDGAQEKQHHEQHNGRHRVANRPGGNVLHDVPRPITTGFTVSPSCRNAPAVVTTLVLGIDAFGDGHAAWHHASHAHRATLDLALRIDDEHVAALVVIEHRGLRQHGALGIAYRHLARAQRRPAADLDQASARPWPFPGASPDQ